MHACDILEMFEMFDATIFFISKLKQTKWHWIDIYLYSPVEKVLKSYSNALNKKMPRTVDNFLIKIICARSQTRAPRSRKSNVIQTEKGCGRIQTRNPIQFCDNISKLVANKKKKKRTRMIFFLLLLNEVEQKEREYKSNVTRSHWDVLGRSLAS